MVEIPEIVRGCVRFASCTCIRLLVQSVEQNVLYCSRFCLEGKGEFQDLDSDVSQRLMGSKLVLDHIQSRFLTAEVNKVTVRYIPQSSLSTNLLFDIEIDSVLSEQFCLHLIDCCF